MREIFQLDRVKNSDEKKLLTSFSHRVRRIFEDVTFCVISSCIAVYLKKLLVKITDAVIFSLDGKVVKCITVKKKSTLEHGKAQLKTMNKTWSMR